MTITEFLLERIAEDEADALPFRNDLGETKQWRCDEIGGAVRYVGARPFGLPDLLAKFEIHAEGAHVARWDPARVLAECSTKRAIIESYVNISKAVDSGAGTAQALVLQGMKEGTRIALALFAAAYADHPDYRTEWAL